MEYTTDYSIFKKNEFNRELDQCNLKKIRNSIMARNLLHLRPILVDENFKVIDGQHRLEVAKLLNLPIYYHIETKLIDEDIILLNANQKHWGLKDYLNYFVNKNNDDYIKLNNFINDNEIDITVALQLLSRESTRLGVRLRSGGFKFPKDVSESNNKLLCLKTVQNLLNEKLIGCKRFIYGSLFVKTLLHFMNYNEVDVNVFIKKLHLNLQLLRPCARALDYLAIYKEIYNFNNRNPLK